MALIIAQPLFGTFSIPEPLWFGEYFYYEKNFSGFFLTEVSASHSLDGRNAAGGGNPWRE